MEEGLEAFHVPQQSRRDKLRVFEGGAGETQPQVHPLGQRSSNQLFQVCSTSLLPLCDTSFASNSGFPCRDFHGETVVTTEEGCKGQSSSSKVEGAGPDLMGFVGETLHSGSSSSFSIPRHPYLDPVSSLPINHGSVQVFNSIPFLPTQQNLRKFPEQIYNGDEVVMNKQQPLSLSLSSQNVHHRYLPLELNTHRYGSTIYDPGYGIPGLFVGATTDPASNKLSRSSVPLGPFTGYALVLKQSRFLKPAQQLLEEICYIRGNGISSEKLTADVSFMELPPPSDHLDSAGDATNKPLGSGDDSEARRKKFRLLTRHDEIYRKYKQYYQQVQAAVSSFGCVAGLGNAAPYANLAVKAMSNHFRCLKNAISDQIQFTSKSHHLLDSHRKESPPRFTEMQENLHGQKDVHNAGFVDQQSAVRQPHRGLPERALTVLRAWLFEHFLHPYPTDTDKQMLAKQTGLTRNQVSNWFINARVRLWKPMVEEMHMLEAQKSSQKDDKNGKRSANHLAPNSLHSDNPSTSSDRVHHFHCNGNGNELPNMQRQDPISLACNTFPTTPPLGVNVGIGSGSSTVSLTLGLHQHHHQNGLSEPFSASADQRFGITLEPSNENYVMGDFDSQLLHGFVRRTA